MEFHRKKRGNMMKKEIIIISESFPETSKFKKIENQLNKMIPDFLEDFKKNLYGIRNWHNVYITRSKKECLK